MYDNIYKETIVEAHNSEPGHCWFCIAHIHVSFLEAQIFKMNHFIKQIRPSRVSYSLFPLNSIHLTVRDPIFKVFGRPHKQLLSQRSWERSMTKSGFDFYDGPIVISGISGRFPMSSNMEELKKNLFDGLEMTSSAAERWRGELQPARFGFLDCLDQFDTSFFNMTPRLAHQVDPQLRLLLEVVFEAILDAGKPKRVERPFALIYPQF